MQEVTPPRKKRKKKNFDCSLRVKLKFLASYNFLVFSPTLYASCSYITCINILLFVWKIIKLYPLRHELKSVCILKKCYTKTFCFHAFVSKRASKEYLFLLILLNKMQMCGFIFVILCSDKLLKQINVAAFLRHKCYKICDRKKVSSSLF